jgi:hypothetical protein
MPLVMHHPANGHRHHQGKHINPCCQNTKDLLVDGDDSCLATTRVWSQSMLGWKAHWMGRRLPCCMLSSCPACLPAPHTASVQRHWHHARHGNHMHASAAHQLIIRSKLMQSARYSNKLLQPCIREPFQGMWTHPTNAMQQVVLLCQLNVHRM